MREFGVQDLGIRDWSLVFGESGAQGFRAVSWELGLRVFGGLRVYRVAF